MTRDGRGEYTKVARQHAVSQCKTENTTFDVYQKKGQSCLSNGLGWVEVNGCFCPPEMIHSLCSHWSNLAMQISPKYGACLIYYLTKLCYMKVSLMKIMVGGVEVNLYSHI